MHELSVTESVLEIALRHAERLCAFGPRPVASAGIVRAADYIERVLERNDWQVEQQEFAYQGERVRNVVGKKGSGPLIILACHYDTRPMADQDPADRSQAIIGANDGASATAVMLELARVLDEEAFGSEGQAKMQVWLAFLGAEERAGVAGIGTSVWEGAIGAKHLAGRVMASTAQRPEYVLVLNMVGDKEQTLYYEWTSTLWLQEKLWSSAKSLGYADYFIPNNKYVVNQSIHTAFLEWGIPAALISDMDYPYWRTRQDTVDKISADSLERVGRSIESMLEGEPFASSLQAGTR